MFVLIYREKLSLLFKGNIKKENLFLLCLINGFHLWHPSVDMIVFLAARIQAVSAIGSQELSSVVISLGNSSKH
jgi:hypothetical protein